MDRRSKQLALVSFVLVAACGGSTAVSPPTPIAVGPSGGEIWQPEESPDQPPAPSAKNPDSAATSTPTPASSASGSSSPGYKPQKPAPQPVAPPKN